MKEINLMKLLFVSALLIAKPILSDLGKTTDSTPIEFNNIGNKTSSSHNYKPSEKKSWTVLTYIAGDNSLGNFITIDLKEMRSGVTNNMNALAFVNNKTNGIKKSQKIVIKSDGFYKDGADLPNLDSGIADTVIAAGMWAIEHYPSDHLAIIFWNHGSGPKNFAPRGICFDDTTGHYLNDYDMQKVLSALKAKNGKNIDIVACDACLMAHLELIHDVAPYADFYVASQETIPGDGFDYKGSFASLNQKLAPADFANKIVDAYKKYYSPSGEDYTLASIQINKAMPLIENINNLSKLLLQGLNSNYKDSIMQAIKSAAFGGSIIRFYDTDYADLYSFYGQLYNNISTLNIPTQSKNDLLNVLHSGMNFIKQSVIANVNSPKFAHAQGVSIYLPVGPIDSTYYKLIWAKDTKWLDLLKSIA